MVEFALIFPVFMLILAGILDFGFMLYSRMNVINAAREGARAAVTAADKTTIPSLVDNTVVSVSSGVSLGLLGSGAGVLVGVAAQHAMPVILGGVLPVDIRERLERHLSGVGASVVADHLGAVTVA